MEFLNLQIEERTKIFINNALPISFQRDMARLGILT